ncbi:MAG: type II toxin-antitoxin system RelE/ParE family toxin [Pseudomonadota bacterium]
MAKYILSPESQKSLNHIKAYSIKNFGVKRTKTYLQSIKKQMQALAENPSLGIIREDLKVGYHSSFVGSHTIYYRVKPTHIDIIDVLHQSMEPSKHISN